MMKCFQSKTIIFTEKNYFKANTIDFRAKNNLSDELCSKICYKTPASVLCLSPSVECVVFLILLAMEFHFDRNYLPFFVQSLLL